MKEALAALLVRKTDEGRQRALREINGLRWATQVVKDAAERSECTIVLPHPSVDVALRASKELQAADYVTAVGLARQAVEARARMIAGASTTLDGQVRARTAIIAEAKKAINEARTARQTRIKAAEETRLQSTSGAEAALRSAENTLRSIRVGEGSTAAGCGLALLLFGPIVATLKQISQGAYLLGGIAWMIGGWFLIKKGLAWILYVARKGQAEAEVSRRQRDLEMSKADADDVFRQAVKEIESDFAMRSAELEAKLGRAETQLQNAKASLASLSAAAAVSDR